MIAQLTPNDAQTSVKAKVVRLLAKASVIHPQTKEEITVAEYVVGDESASVILKVIGDQSLYTPGHVIELQDVRTEVIKGQLRLVVNHRDARYGGKATLGEGITQANEDTNISETLWSELPSTRNVLGY